MSKVWGQNSIPGLIRIEYPGEQDAVELQGYVVGGDGTLARYFYGDFLQTLDVGDSVQEWDEDG